MWDGILRGMVSDTTRHAFLRSVPRWSTDSECGVSAVQRGWAMVRAFPLVPGTLCFLEGT